MLIGAPKEIKDNEFRVGFNRGPGPGVASALNRIFHAGDVFLFRAGERPDFIDLDSLGLHAANFGIMKAGAELSRVHKQLGHSVDAGIRQARDGTHRGPFAEHREHLGAGGYRELVHGSFYMNFCA